MFIVVGRQRLEAARRALGAFGALLAPSGTIDEIDLGSLTLLSWMTRAGDEVTVDVRHDAGSAPIFIGYSPRPSGDVDRHPLASGALIERQPTVRITPVGVRNIYRDGRSVSDSSLLLAAVEHRSVSPLHVAILATTTYLPGRLTLFPEIRRLQFNSRLTLSGDSWSESMLPWPEPAESDEQLVERITDALVSDRPATMAMTSGYDSRFVLGVLRRAGRSVSLVHKSEHGREVELVRALADAADLPLSIVGNDGPEILDPLRHTAATDACVYLIGNTLMSLKDLTSPGEEIHFGHVCSVKNGYIGAFNRQPPRADMVASTIENILLPDTRELPRIGVDPIAARSLLTAELSDQLDLLPLQTNKAKGTFLYYLNRGLRWTDAHHGGLSLFNPTISPMSELTSSIWSFGTSMWDNLGYDRVRRLNRQYGFDLDLPYGDGGRAAPYPAVVRPLRKVRYEYLNRFLDHRNQTRASQSKPTAWGDVATDADRQAFDQIGVTVPLEQLLGGPGSRSLKRAAITAAHAARLASLDLSSGRADH